MLPRAGVKRGSSFPGPQRMVLILLPRTAVKSAGRPRKLLSEARTWRTGWLPKSDEDGADYLAERSREMRRQAEQAFQRGREGSGDQAGCVKACRDQAGCLR